MKNIGKTIGEKYQELLMVIVGSVILFLISAFWIEPVCFERWDESFWCSGSTIKFVNSWLQEGALQLRFLMFENPASIEFADLAARGPYVSYPSLSCVIPYLIARLCNMSQIDAVFIRKVAIGMFGLDTIMVSLISLMIGKYCTSIKNSMLLVYGAVGMGFWWSMLPASQYFLKNIFFADEAILFWIYLMVLLELYMETHQDINVLKWKKYLFITVRFIVILVGMWTDYYFWVFMFIACLLRFILNKNRMSVWKNTIELVKNYIAPVFFAVTMFAAQVMSVPNGWNSLILKGKFRTSSFYNGQNMYISILDKIKRTLFLEGGIVLAVSFVIVVIYILYSSIVVFKKKQQIANSFLFLTAGLLMLPPLLQILILKNHSGIHEFSMVKLGVPCVFGLLFVALILDQISRKMLKRFLFPIVLFVFLTVGGTVSRESTFYSNSVWSSAGLTEEEEDLTYAINKYLRGYDIVLFSNTEEIPANPPILLAKAGKRIYLIEKYSDIIEMFPNLNENARKIFVISKDHQEEILDSEFLRWLDEEKLIFVSAYYEFYELEK